ncbi:MAG: type II toxin-antitoxin system RelB/DinJ family antitoxin [Caldilineaceae bacterium]|nr:type II toxin-antitoxin system RelB/DinJ family antitoxin [Caldilineaceae bacterium]MCB0123928.1 type II toxin-antitoxin system RelB/DinJ family antitoxin [Caldilineaceae bacterium]MCB0187858.1 type II toxin-antitoxin system RelB/DinJ family antitoxin [Caldilineaceae bacterium]
MPNVTIQSRVKPELKQEAEAIFDAIGLSMGDAIRLFLQQSVNIGGLPFQPMVKQPNAETLAALDELESGQGKRFATVDELFADLEAD